MTKKKSLLRVLWDELCKLGRLLLMIPQLIKPKKIQKSPQKPIFGYVRPTILKAESGSYDEWENTIFSNDSSIGIILGARGKGKTALGMRFLENYHAKTLKPCFAMGFSSDSVPAWINCVQTLDEIHNGSLVLIDEGGILFSSRKSMSKANQMLSELILIARHKNLSVLFISQNSSNLEINILRQADYLMLKPSSLLQLDFERKKIKELYEQTHKDFLYFKLDKGVTYIYSDGFNGFISNSLPSFWNTKVSKSFQ